MDFFAHQAQARRSTARLLGLFIAAVVTIVVAIDGVVLMVIAGTAKRISRHPEQIAGVGLAGHSTALTVTSIVVLAIIGLGTLYKIGKLSGGGGVVARQLGGTLIEADTTQFAYRRLRNIVEEVAIASGVPVPEIYVLEQETGINAFAAGFTPADAAITVTRGCLDKLTRDELQGVIAHEFSHVLNGDMRLNIRLMGVLFGILVIGVVAREILFNSRGDGDKESVGILLVVFAVMCIGYIGLFFGRLIKASVSRQREYLADASAVQFTRQPTGISGALKKIAGLAEGSRLTSADGEEVSHMFFGDGVGYSDLFASHPPLLDRIRKIEPRFDPRELVDIGRRWSQLVRARDADDAAGSISGLVPSGASGDSAAAALHAAPPPPRPVDPFAAAAPRSPPAPRPQALPNATQRIAINAKGVAGQVGNPAADDYKAAHGIGGNVPESLQLAAHMQDYAPAVVLALALNLGPELRARQIARIEADLGPDLARRSERLATEIDSLHPILRLPLASIAFPALRRKPRAFLKSFVAALDHLIHADGLVEVGEYCLARLVSVQVIESLDPSKTRISGRRKLIDCMAELAQLFAVLAQAGQDQPEAAQRAYVAGVSGLILGPVPPYQPPADIALALDRALPALDGLNLSSKELLIEALVRTMAFDGAIAVAEADLLRTICASLHCPLPPMLSEAGAGLTDND